MIRLLVLGVASLASRGDAAETNPAQASPAPTVRSYYIAAEPAPWRYAPTGVDEMCGIALSPSAAQEGELSKLRYFEYTDASFTTRVRETPSLGILGPVLRGVVGDTLRVTFLNRAGQPLSMHPHGVKYDKDSEGAYYQPGPGRGASIKPGDSFTYVWQLDEASGPRPDEPSSKGWLYHSHVVGDDEINQGLIGCIIVTDPKRARPDGTPADVDRELATLFLIFDESGLGAEEKEAYEYVDNGSGIPLKSWAQIQETMEIASRAAINGRTFGNLRGLEMNEGERVRWYLFGLGSQQDFHTAHWHGQRVVEEGRRRTDVIELLPASMKVADLLADNPGDWMFHCHVTDHMREGMFAKMTVFARGMIGADRTPAAAFLGLTGSLPNPSVVLKQADWLPPLKPGSGTKSIRLAGTATIPEAFTLFRQKIRIEAGDHTLVFAPGKGGSSQVGGETGGTLLILNAGPSGVIHGGQIEFEITLRGDAWAQVLAAKETSEQKRAIAFDLVIGDARHHVVAELRPTARE